MEILNPNIAILILAAGSSSRMGEPKQLLAWKDTTLLENAIKNALASQCKVVSVVLGANAKAIRKQISEYQIEVIENTSWKSGLGTSIATGVDTLSDKTPDIDGLLVMLADQPLIDTVYLNLMIESFVKHRKPIIATAYKSRAGVPALFDKKYFDELVQLSADDYGAKKIINRSNSEVFIIDPKYKSIDIDTPSEYLNLINTIK